MKKNCICLVVIFLILTACSNENHSTVQEEKNISTQFEQQVSSESVEQAQGAVQSFWDKRAVDSAKENNILSFVTGLQIILPQEWNGEIVTSVSPGLTEGADTLKVANKKM